jgi:hypothetical protein
MSMDVEFLTTARQHFDPFLLSSGTELVSPLLYSLARMLRPRSVVEFGSGYSTLFILRALADNVAAIEAEKNALLAKTKAARLLERWGPDRQPQADMDAAAHDWLDSGGVACGVDPVFYCKEYAPHLFSFEHLPEDHEYVEHMRSAVDAIGHTSLFTQFCEQGFAQNTLPPEFLPLDWVWNDCHYDLEFLSEFWEYVNPSGGLLILHNITGHSTYFQTLQSFVEQRAPYGDLEHLVLEEPHKLMQNGCAILRRTTAYQPRFSLTYTHKKEGPPVVPARPEEVLQALRTLLSD